MQLLSKLNSLDNVADGSTRKLLKTATSSGSGSAVTAITISGDTLTYEKKPLTELILSSNGSGSGSIVQETTSNELTHVLPNIGGTLLNTGNTSFSPILSSGTEIATIKINGQEQTLYAPASGSIETALAKPNQTYYLTGVQNTTSGASDLYNSYLSRNFTGVKYVTATSSEGGSLYVDDREVVTGLYYSIS